MRLLEVNAVERGFGEFTTRMAAARHKPFGHGPDGFDYLLLAHSMQRRAVGLASRRAGAMGWPHFSQFP